MALVTKNLSYLLTHPSIPIPVYAAGITAAIPIRTWANQPCSSLFGVVAGTFVALIVEGTIPGPVGTKRCVLMALSAMTVGWGLYRLATVPVDLSPETPRPMQSAAAIASVMDEQIASNLEIRENYTGFQMYGQNVAPELVPDFSAETLNAALRGHLSADMIQQIANMIRGLVDVHGIFFHGKRSGLRYLVLGSIAEPHRNQIISYSVGDVWAA